MPLVACIGSLCDNAGAQLGGRDKALSPYDRKSLRKKLYGRINMYCFNESFGIKKLE